jgi:hypothetical protein
MSEQVEAAASTVSGEVAFAALQAAVTLARDRKIRSADDLLRVVISEGFAPEEADAGIALWRDHLQAQGPAALQAAGEGWGWRL